MTFKMSSLRRLFLGKETGKVLAVLLAGSLLLSGGFVPTYLAKAFASSVRNAYFSGTGVLYYTFVFFFLYVQAVILTAIYFVLRYGSQTLRKLLANEASA